MGVKYANSGLMFFVSGRILSATLLFIKIQTLSSQAVITLYPPTALTTSDPPYRYVRCYGSRSFPNQSDAHNYCVYYYKFPQKTCDDTMLKFQGRTYNANPEVDTRFSIF
ncbi:hypothetical protein OESDEN_08695 [Oesophagostomum dentatum]|uniref:Uncharacterized protein n=1 Tax=Oesophagostomum dentatum TaxID=61180 RepID=A0A0B1T5L1_OESDE|nr:hypothetical protein OESDEN_08695 [Oesophagostomum dentatum]